MIHHQVVPVRGKHLKRSHNNVYTHCRSMCAERTSFASWVINEEASVACRLTLTSPNRCILILDAKKTRESQMSRRNTLLYHAGCQNGEPAPNQTCSKHNKESCPKSHYLLSRCPPEIFRAYQPSTSSHKPAQPASGREAASILRCGHHGHH